MGSLQAIAQASGRLSGAGKNLLVRRRYRSLAARLCETSESELVAQSEAAAVAAFQRAARRVPAYAALLRQAGVRPRDVDCISRFRELVPTMDKGVYRRHRLRDLCVDGRLRDGAHFHTSSGFSGAFSFGLSDADHAARAALGVEFLLDQAFGVLRRKTLLVNCLPMGVKIETRSLSSVQSSVRADAVVALLQQLADEFAQLLLIGEHHFLKRVVDEGAEAGLPWRQLLVQMVTGGEYIPESWRGYIGKQLGTAGHSASAGQLAVSYGISELALSLFRETEQTIRLRQLAGADPQLRAAIYGEDAPYCPCIMQHLPQQALVETVPGGDGQQRLVVTTLDPSLPMPLIRYNTGDVVGLISHERLSSILTSRGLQGLIPPMRLPLVIAWGRPRPLVTAQGERLYPEVIKEALYQDHAIATALSGNFRLRRATAGDRTELLVQRRPGRALSPAARRRFESLLREQVSPNIELQLPSFEQLPGGVDQDYQRKPRYVG